MSKRCVITPDCPRCGSKKTGYYMFLGSYSELNKIKARKMERGELVKFSIGFEDASQPNLFCEDCGVEWRGVYTSQFLTTEALQKIKKEKGIEDSEIESLKNYKKFAKKNKKKHRRQRLGFGVNFKSKSKTKTKTKTKINKNKKDGA